MAHEDIDSLEPVMSLLIMSVCSSQPMMPSVPSDGRGVE